MLSCVPRVPRGRAFRGRQLRKQFRECGSGVLLSQPRRRILASALIPVARLTWLPPLKNISPLCREQAQGKRIATGHEHHPAGIWKLFAESEHQSVRRVTPARVNALAASTNLRSARSTAVARHLAPPRFSFTCHRLLGRTLLLFGNWEARRRPSVTHFITFFSWMSGRRFAVDQATCPFDSIESAHEFLQLLSDASNEAKQTIDVELKADLASTSKRRRDALLLAAYKIDKLQLHLKISVRILNDLRSLRRLLFEERTAPQVPKFVEVLPIKHRVASLPLAAVSPSPVVSRRPAA